jgi:ADP-ribosyl-[dinitrogen reductase] hydrolase
MIGAVTRDRMIGSYMGLAIGDALGAPVEFQNAAELKTVTTFRAGGWLNLTAGEWTDDTAMARALATSIIACGGEIDPQNIMSLFSEWLNKNRFTTRGTFVDCGKQTGAAIDFWQKNRTFLLDPVGSGNGSLMRLAPVVIATNNLEDWAAVIAAQQSSLPTHNSAEVMDCVAIMTIMMRRCFRGKSPLGNGFLEDVLPVVELDRVKSLVRAWADPEFWTDMNDEPPFNPSGYCIDSLEAACYAVATSVGFADAVLSAVNLGGDADTVGAITGQIAGAFYGRSNMPYHWLTTVSLAANLQDEAAHLAGLASKK